jgi:hypothetical protein
VCAASPSARGRRRSPGTGSGRDGCAVWINPGST